MAKYSVSRAFMRSMRRQHGDNLNVMVNKRVSQIKDIATLVDRPVDEVARMHYDFAWAWLSDPTNILISPYSDVEYERYNAGVLAAQVDLIAAICLM